MKIIYRKIQHPCKCSPSFFEVEFIVSVHHLASSPPSEFA